MYYRLNVLDLHVPSLRERASDLPLLWQHFLQRYTAKGREPSPITARAYRAMAAHPFPGNVRELAHAVERAVLLAQGGHESRMPALRHHRGLPERPARGGAALAARLGHEGIRAGLSPARPGAHARQAVPAPQSCSASRARVCGRS